MDTYERTTSLDSSDGAYDFYDTNYIDDICYKTVSTSLPYVKIKHWYFKFKYKNKIKYIDMTYLGISDYTESEMLKIVRSKFMWRLRLIQFKAWFKRWL